MAALIGSSDFVSVMDDKGHGGTPPPAYDPKNPVPMEFDERNGGFNLYRRTSAVEALFRAWMEVFVWHSSEGDNLPKVTHDQPALREARGAHQPDELDLNLGDFSGKTAMMHAAMFGSDAAVQNLLKFGADHTLQDQEAKTALDHARQRGHAAVILTIERWEATISFLAYFGMTMAHC